MAELTDEKLAASKADIKAARKCIDAVGAAAATLDVERVITSKDDILAFYGGAPVKNADIVSITPSTPSAGFTRITFNFTLETGVEVIVYA